MIVGGCVPPSRYLIRIRTPWVVPTIVPRIEETLVGEGYHCDVKDKLELGRLGTHYTKLAQGKTEPRLGVLWFYSADDSTALVDFRMEIYLEPGKRPSPEEKSAIDHIGSLIYEILQHSEHGDSLAFERRENS